MLLFMSRSRKTKTPSQSSERGIVATGKPDEVLGSLFVERYVRFLRGPEMIKQNGQLTSYCNDGLVSGLLAASGGQMQAPLSKRRVPPVRSKDVVGTLDQQTSEVSVSSLRDAKLGIVVSGLAALRLEAEITTDISALLEPLLTSQGKDEGESSDGTNAVNLLQGLCLRIVRLADLLDLAIVLLDPEGHLGDLIEHRVQRLRKSWRHYGQASLREAAGRGSRHTVPARLGQTTHSVHRCGAESHHDVPCADQDQRLLLFDSSVRDRTQDLGIQPCVASQLLGIDLVALPVTVRDSSQLSHVGHDYLMAKFLQLFADPDRVRSGLHRNPRLRHVGKPLLDRLRCRPEAAAVDHLTILVERAVMTPNVAKINADRGLDHGSSTATSAS